jgi:hypothetical protein
MFNISMLSQLCSLDNEKQWDVSDLKLSRRFVVNDDPLVRAGYAWALSVLPTLHRNILLQSLSHEDAVQVANLNRDRRWS